MPDKNAVMYGRSLHKKYGIKKITQTSHMDFGYKALINAGWNTNELISCIFISLVIVMVWLSFVKITLLIVLEYTNDVNALFDHLPDKGLTGKPDIHQNITCPDSCLKSVMNHFDGRLRFMKDGILSVFIAAAPLLK